MFFFSFSQTHALCMSWPPSRRSAHRLSMFQNPAKLPIFQQIAVHCKHASLTFHCFGYSIAMIAISRLFRTATCQQLLERDVRGKLDQLLTPEETMHKSKQKKMKETEGKTCQVSPLLVGQWSVYDFHVRSLTASRQGRTEDPWAGHGAWHGRRRIANIWAHQSTLRRPFPPIK